MRFLVCFCCSLVSIPLSAQLLFGGNSRGWDVSVSFAPQFHRFVRVSGASEELSSETANGFRGGRLDTVSINGTDRLFTSASRLKMKPTDMNFWFGGNLRLHRRFNRGFDIALGLYYSTANYTSRAAVGGIVGANGSIQQNPVYLYPVDAQREQQGGLTIDGTYHLFAGNRLHPYFGMGISTLLERRKTTQIGRRYSRDGTELPPANIIDDRFLTQFIYEFDFYFTAGVLYSLSNRWSVGLDLTSRNGNGRGLVGFQLRRHLGVGRSAP